MQKKLKIKVISPSSGVSGAEQILLQGQDLLNDKIILSYSAKIFADPELPFFAANYENRKNDLIDAITSLDYDIIWVARGGYGAGNLIEDCLDIVPSPNNKPIIGFSDSTVLHILFNQHYKIPTIHGEGIYSFINKNYKSQLFKEIFSGETVKYPLIPFLHSNNNEINAAVSGGNLTMITTLVGTKLHPNFNNKILFLEDVNEKGYRIHRSLMHLKQSGVLEHVAAMIFGDFSKGDEHIFQSIEHFCKTQVSMPCFYVHNIGHGEVNLPIVFGSHSKISNNILEVTSPFKFEFYSLMQNKHYL